ncbi:MAG: peptidylprolyl isomerase, partial [Spirochaetales bacterium]|nr:peptidylprolyl isomerase [Spirochaetales bacterium]
IESNAGYHIVKVAIHNDTKILGIDDKTSPTSDVTVRDYIANGIYESKMNTVFQQAYLSLISDLKNSASIRYLTK